MAAVNVPALEVASVRAEVKSVLRIVTFAPATALPCGSVTAPLITPLAAADCANNGDRN